MKRRNGSSTRSTRLVAQQSSADQSVTLFKLEDPDDEHSPDPSVAGRHSKRIKVEAKAAELLPSTENGEAGEALDDGRRKEKAKAAASPHKAKAKAKAKEIKQALDTPHPAPARWRETYDAIREMRTRFPAPVDTMGCDTAKWKETDPRVRLPLPPSPAFSILTLARGGARISASRHSSRSCSPRRPKTR